jgi:hypothetical protein
MVYVMPIWCILWPFGVFFPFWFIVPRKLLTRRKTDRLPRQQHRPDPEIDQVRDLGAETARVLRGLVGRLLQRPGQVHPPLHQEALSDWPRTPKGLQRKPGK